MEKLDRLLNGNKLRKYDAIPRPRITAHELARLRRRQAILAWLVRRLTSVVRLATRLVELIPERESRRDDGG